MRPFGTVSETTPTLPTPPSHVGTKRRRKPIEWIALLLSWVLATAWSFAVIGASVGVFTYFGIEEPCSDAPHPGEGTLAMWLIALVALGGGAIWSSIASGPTLRTRAARRSVRSTSIFLLISLMPFVALFGLLGFPYVFGLNIRAGSARSAAGRWLFAIGACVASVVSVSYWFDAFACM